MAAARSASADEQETVSYAMDVRPILSDKCFACHGPDPNSREADLRLDTADGATKDLGGYAAIVSGDPKASEALTRMLSEDENDRMPPAYSHKTMTPAEIEVVRAWVAQGARYQQHWSHRPLNRPSPPEVAGPRPSNEIDAFVRAAAESHGITQMAPQADRTTLVRRLYFDLLGVPPTTEQVNAFLADKSPDAYEKLVDRLLADPRFGERMAVYWLDLVRYADTIGYHSDNYMEVSAYRDYVIDSFNENKPYDQFTIEQLAGDLLPSATREQLIATGYNRLLQTTEEGGAQPKEYIAIYAADRVRSFSEVWLGSTMGCAQCHDHKYDPFTQRDFYSLAAFFADVAEQPIGSRDPNLMVPTAEQEEQLEELEQRLQASSLENTLQSDPKLRETLEAAQNAWEEDFRRRVRDSEFAWLSPELVAFSNDSRLEMEQLPDNSLLMGGARPYEATYEVDIKAAGTVRMLRLEVLTHPSFRGEKRLSNNHRDFVLTEVRLSVDGQELRLANPTTEFEQPGYPIAQAIDGNAKTGWATAGRPAVDRIAAAFELAEPLELPEDGKTLRITMVHRSIFGQHHIGRFRIGLSEETGTPVDGPDAVPVEVVRAVETEPSARTERQRQVLADYYRTFAPELEKWREDYHKLIKERVALEDRFQTTLVAESLSTPRMMRILPRGNWLDDSGDIVSPATPEFLTTGAPSQERLDRLDLAQWVVAPENPLTARTFVNRAWMLLFGRGLSPDVGDLGGQGQPPTHPELLDWLAVEFRDSGWDIKRLVRQMVTSDTYRRSSAADAELVAADPTNRWFARQNRWRLDAEFVRDTALSISGLLDDSRIGGLSVKPYQPEGYWQHLNFPTRRWIQSNGDDLYRRSLYTFWCRTFLHPSLQAFDAPSREECTARRAKSNIPQQALVLLNDPIYVEAAKVFAVNTSEQPGSKSEKIAWAVQQATSRAALDEEVALLAELFDEQLKVFQAHPDRAKQLLAVGAAPSPETIDPAELAAWTQVTRALMAMYETTSRN
ncbi:PSD1 and planctomycete cytochrome C domain-containing protein [Aeoliella sp.]|uniref:PSD1 and planctomycete cytochrome C domain-containing protein n=1 Tax=Aeoliella sp. TaxID=2795800 RepID=UPI003CCBD871